MTWWHRRPKPAQELVDVWCECCTRWFMAERYSPNALSGLCPPCGEECWPARMQRKPGEELIPHELLEYRRDLVAFYEYRDILRKRYSR